MVRNVLVLLIGDFEKFRKVADQLLDAGIDRIFRQYLNVEEATKILSDIVAEAVIMGANIPEKDRAIIQVYLFLLRPKTKVIAFDPADPDQTPALIQELKRKPRKG